MNKLELAPHSPVAAQLVLTSIILANKASGIDPN